MLIFGIAACIVQASLIYYGAKFIDDDGRVILPWLACFITLIFVIFATADYAREAMLP